MNAMTSKMVEGLEAVRRGRASGVALGTLSALARRGLITLSVKRAPRRPGKTAELTIIASAK